MCGPLNGCIFCHISPNFTLKSKTTKATLVEIWDCLDYKEMEFFNFIRIRSLTFLVFLLIASCSSHQTLSPAKSLIPFSQLISGFDETTRIENFQPISRPQPLKNIGNNASGITWDPYLKQYFVIQNSSAIIYQYDKDFNFQGQLRKSGNIHNDTEGVTAIDGENLILVTEANIAYQINIADAIGRGSYGADAVYQIDSRPKRKNKGYEAIAYRPAATNRGARIYAGQEGTRRYADAKMRVVYFEADIESSFFGSHKSALDDSLKIVEPFNAEEKLSSVIGDISGMAFDPTGHYLIIVSQESSKAIQVDPENGDIISQLSLKGAPAYEGVTIGPQGDLVFVSERNWIQVYRQNNRLQ